MSNLPDDDRLTVVVRRELDPGVGFGVIVSFLDSGERSFLNGVLVFSDVNLHWIMIRMNIFKLTAVWAMVLK